METLSIVNPFDAPVFYKETVTSTMDEARLLAVRKSGTTIAADEQTAGRGRSGRSWSMKKGENLSFTIMLQFGSIEAIPSALTLRTGLAVALGIEDFAPSLAGRILLKWPNDLMIAGFSSGKGPSRVAKKAAGILAEAEGGNVYIGIGINVAQKLFPPELEEKACSIAQALSCSGDSETAAPAEKRFSLLEKILFRLHDELCGGRDMSDWRIRLEEKLYMKGRRVSFVSGLPEELAIGPVSAEEGLLHGIGEGGEILITRDSGKTVSFMAGELRLTR